MISCRLAAISIVSFLLIACGGGGGDGGGGNSASGSSSTTSSSGSSSSSSSGGASSGSSSSGGAASSSGSSSSSSSGGACGVEEFPLQGFATLNGGTTGGEGGPVVYATTGTEIHEAMCNRATSDSPVIIHVEGVINHDNTGGVSGACGAGDADDVIEIKNVSNVSIIGVGGGALFDEIGIHIRSASNIVLRNLHVRNVKKSGSPLSNGGDAIGMEADVSNVWVDHVTLEASGGESEGFDALFDMKDNTQYVTLSYSRLLNSGRGGLVGSSDSDDLNDFITYHHNWYQNIDSRTPLLRHAEAHSYNNYFNGINETGINSRMGALIRIENNHFKNSSNPILSKDSSAIGFWDVRNNLFENVDWNASTCNGEAPGTCLIAFNGTDVPSTTTYDPPYAYTLDDAEDVEEIVTACAGAGIIDVPPGGGSSSASSSTSGGSSSGSSSSSSSGGSGPGSTFALPFTEDFSAADAATFFSTGYRTLASDSGAALYRVVNGSFTVDGNGIAIGPNDRFTIGQRSPFTATTSGTTPGGDLDLSQPYTITFTVVSNSGTGGNFQIQVDNNTTSGANSIHGGSSRIYSQPLSALPAAGNVFSLNSSVGSASSFIMLRCESGCGEIVIDNLAIQSQ